MNRVLRLIAAIPAVLLPMLSTHAAGPVTTLTSQVFELDSMPYRVTNYGRFYSGLDAPVPGFGRLETHYSTIKANTYTHKPHRHAVEEIILVKDGTLTFFLNGKEETVGPGSLVFAAAHDFHGLKNPNGSPASFYVVNAYTYATAHVREQPAIEWEPAGLLHSTIITWDRLVPKKTVSGWRRNLVDSPTLTFSRLEIHATTVRPGLVTGPLHRNPAVSVFIVKEGTIEASIDGVDRRADSGSMFVIPPNSLHIIRNPGTLTATYFVISLMAAPPGQPDS
jgi:(S)-ureidoglycine aminohydrolase